MARKPSSSTPPECDILVLGDCITGMKKLPKGCIDLAFADPPFNIGYTYDAYDDKRTCEDYLVWSREWISEVIRLLKPGGAFWLAIGDEYAADLKVMTQRQLGLTCRNWVVWYYTFGVHCKYKFTRSHAHLFYFVKPGADFTFHDDAVRVPSARQLVYADSRAVPKGRLPDDTWIIRPVPTNHEGWILRPQDIPDSFEPGSDTWYFPRVCGTFKERMRFHGCQMPEQLLGRIIKACSNEGELVLDPFAGSGTTLAVARKLGRKYLGFEISKDYVKAVRQRLTHLRPGDPLDGTGNPLTSVASTDNGTIRTADGKRVPIAATQKTRHPWIATAEQSHGASKAQQRLSDKRVESERLQGAVRAAFKQIHEGLSVDRVLADKGLNAAFVEACGRLGIPGTPVDWNTILLGLRKANKLSDLRPMRAARLDHRIIEACEFASECAWRLVSDRYQTTLDGILCNPEWAAEFDRIASGITSGYEPLYYRWAALHLRKQAKAARTAAESLPADLVNRRFSPAFAVGEFLKHGGTDGPGVYLLKDVGDLSWRKRAIYVGETADVRHWLETCGALLPASLSEHIKLRDIAFSFLRVDDRPLTRRALKALHVMKRQPPLNHPDFSRRAA